MKNHKYQGHQNDANEKVSKETTGSFNPKEKSSRENENMTRERQNNMENNSKNSFGSQKKSTAGGQSQNFNKMKNCGYGSCQNKTENDNKYCNECTSCKPKK